MKYNTLIPSYDIEKKQEYNKPCTTPDTLNGMKLFAIGGNLKDGFCSNWDLYIDDSGTIHSIARTGSTAKNSYFGDTRHIKSLIRQGYWNNDTLTAIGFRWMKGELKAV